jgi:hypothetical protein
MHYTVNPGLYGVGNPSCKSPVLVTANYKLSFDRLRRELAGFDAWVLVLDTKGINVWCAAGKGTFGTGELIARIESSGLEKVVCHRKIVLPQLGAPGIKAHEVTRATGFGVVYGPVHASDIPRFFDCNMKADSAMRRVTFPLRERIILTPMELEPALKYFWYFALAVLVYAGLSPEGILFVPAVTRGWPLLLYGAVATVVGSVLVPVLLPWIPFRWFSAKGLLMGMAAWVALLPVMRPWLSAHTLPALATFVGLPAFCSFLGFNFTGSTPFTSRSGVKKELRVAIPLYILSGTVAGALLIAAKVVEMIG